MKRCRRATFIKLLKKSDTVTSEYSKLLCLPYQRNTKFGQQKEQQDILQLQRFTSSISTIHENSCTSCFRNYRVSKQYSFHQCLKLHIKLGVLFIKGMFYSTKLKSMKINTVHKT